MFPHVSIIYFYYLFKHPSFISVVSSDGWLVGLLADWCAGVVMSFPFGNLSLSLEVVPTVVAVR